MIERMRWMDIAPVVVLDEKSFGNQAWTEEFFWSQMAVPGNRFWVARDGNQVVGYVGLSVSGPQGDILTLASDRRGVGSRLLDVAMDAAREAGVEALYLDVRDDNERAIYLYASRGFEEINRRAAYYSDADALIMRSSL